MDPIAVRKRLDDLIRARGDDYASVSRLLGRNQAYIQQFVRRGVPRRLSEEDRRRLAAHYGVAERSLGGPDAPVTAPERAAPPPVDGVVAVRSFDVGASAGEGALAVDEVGDGSLLFPARIARTLASGGVERLSAIRVEGHSMHPTLSDGDEIVVDAADAEERLREGVYVIRRDGDLLVKRLAVDPATRTLSIRSDNPAYSSVEGVPRDAVTILGRVAWLSRRLG